MRWRCGGVRMITSSAATTPAVGDGKRPAGVRSSTRYFAEVESLRGLAILLVFVFHAAAVLWPLAGRPGTRVSLLAAFVWAGHTGVSLFFVLSAFLLSQPFLREGAGGGAVARLDYYKRRALRILPLYYVAVVVAVLWTVRRPADLWHSLPCLLFVPCSAASLFPFSSVWWSLATEVQFYVLLPLLPYALGTRTGRWIGTLAFAVYAALYGYVTMRGGTWFLFGGGPERIPMQQALVHSLFGRAPLLLAGILASYIHCRWALPIARRLSQRAWLRRGGADLLLLATVSGLGYLLRAVVDVGYWHAELVRPGWHVVEGVLWAIVLLLLLLAPLRTKPLLCNRALAAIGVVSYSVYLNHVPILYAAFVVLPVRLPLLAPERLVGRTPLAVVLVGAVSLGVAALTYRCIERPFLVRKAQLDR